MSQPSTDTASANKQVILDMYAAFGTPDLPAVLTRTLHPEAQWGMPDGAPARIAYFGRDTGPAGALRHLGGYVGDFEFKSFDAVSIAATDDRVLALVEQDLVARSTGKPVHQRVVHCFRLADGRVVDFFPVLDTARLVDALTA